MTTETVECIPPTQHILTFQSVITSSPVANDTIDTVQYGRLTCAQ